MCALLKAGDPYSIDRMVGRVRMWYVNGKFRDFFQADTVLVPIPGSTPLRDQASLWVGERLCRAMVRIELGCEVAPIAFRKSVVPKSAYQRPGDRPTSTVHYESIEVRREIVEYRRLLLVDDVITKGNTLLGVASRVREAFPNSEISAFAMIRTKGLQPDIESVHGPVEDGEISRMSDDNASREP